MLCGRFVRTVQTTWVIRRAELWGSNARVEEMNIEYNKKNNGPVL